MSASFPFFCRFKVLRYLFTVLLLTVSSHLYAVGSDSSPQLDKVTRVILGVLSYTRWPDNPEALQLCVIGPTEYADEFIMQTFQIANRTVTTRRLASDDTALTSQCHAVYTGVINEAERKVLFARLQDKPILSIAEQNDSCSTGSMFCLQFGLKGEVTFLVNLDSIARSTIRVHPNVLLLGKRRSED